MRVQKTLCKSETVQSCPVKRCAKHAHRQMTMTLDQLRPGQEAFISKLSSCNRLGRRLLDMGIYPGLHIHVIRNAPLEDPMEIKVDGYHISLRHEEAKVVEIFQK
jgi:ferrous iron transport protein A